MLGVSVRRPNESDIEELHRFFKITITDTFNKEGVGDDLEGINEEIKEKKLLLQEYLECDGTEYFFLIVCHNKRIVGAIAYVPCNKLIVDFSKGELKNIGEIGTVFVLPEYQRNGIGTIMINAMFISLLSRNVKEFCLDSGYKTAQQIWMKRFGEPRIIIKNHWGEGVDHYIWHCKLKDMLISYKI